MREWIRNLDTSGNHLFCVVSLFTVIYWAILGAQTATGTELVRTPSVLDEFYIALLATYAGVNQVDKACNGKDKARQKRPGHVFFLGWMAFAAFLAVLAPFGMLYAEETLSSVWLMPLAPILGIFGGSATANYTKKLVQEAKSTLNGD